MYTAFDAGEVLYKVKSSVQELVPLLVKYGIGGINPPAELLEDPIRAREAARCVADAGLKWSLLPTPADFLSFATDDTMFDAGLEKLKIWADTGAMMGVKYAYSHIFPGSDERDYERNFDWHAIRIGRVNRVLKGGGIRYGIEFLGPWDLRNMFRYPFIHTIAGQRALCAAVDPTIGFVFDTFHWYTGCDADMDDLRYAAQNVHDMICFHINDGIAGKGAREQRDLTRAMPMTTGVIDSVTPYRLFRDRGYQGPVLAEPINPIYEDFRKMPAEEVVRIIAECYGRMEALADGR